MFTEFDVIVCVIILGSMMLSMANGFLKDVFGLVAWIGAAAVTLIFYPWAAQQMGEVVTSAPVVNAIAVIVVYLGSYFFISIVNRGIIGSAKDGKGGAIDRSFGALFGIVKGLVVVSIVHFSVVQVAGEAPEWLQSGKTYGMTEMGADLVKSGIGDLIKDPEAVAEDVLPVVEGSVDSAQDAVEGAVDAAEETVEEIQDGAHE